MQAPKKVFLIRIWMTNPTFDQTPPHNLAGHITNYTTNIEEKKVIAIMHTKHLS